jgi:hypothetical protein
MQHIRLPTKLNPFEFVTFPATLEKIGRTTEEYRDRIAPGAEL